MKRLMAVVLLAALGMALAVVPAAAGAKDETFGVDLDATIEWAFSNEDGYGDHDSVRFDKIDEAAFMWAMGILTIQLSVGNNNVLQAQTVLSVAEADDDLLAASATLANNASFDEYENGIRFDKITDTAFQYAQGIITVQMSSGNANALQSIVDVNVDPSVVYIDFEDFGDWMCSGF